MKNIILFDPSIRSYNKGDEIIFKSIEKELTPLLENNFIIRCATHAPAITFYQNTRKNPEMRIYSEAEYKFVCGSNLLWKNMLMPRPSWNVNLFNCMPYQNCILVGVGIGLSHGKINYYTRKLYSKILSADYIHSVRDSVTEKFLTELGYRAIDTGCPTMWNFTSDFCAQIPQNKAAKVIFTLTDYCKDKEKDQWLIDFLKNNYDKVYFWVQGEEDYMYFLSLKNTSGINVIPPSLQEYSKILTQNDIDYIGTRLHAGMFALQHQKRTIILSIDNRVRDMKKSYNLISVERENICSELEEIVKSSFVTSINIKENNIKKWMSQFYD